MSFVVDISARFRPPAPPRLEAPINAARMLYGLWTNPIATWSRQAFESLVHESDGVMGRLFIVSDPAAIRHVFVDNVENYRRDALQLRILKPSLGNGLFTAEGEDWRMQRRALASLFSPRAIASFLPAMRRSARWLMERWEPLRDGRRVDVAQEMSRVTLDVLERTIFPDGLGRDPALFQQAAGQFFEAAGQFHPFDIVNLPRWVPRVGRKRADPAMLFFKEAIDEMIAARRQWRADNPLAAGEDGPGDLLTRLLDARDPQTGAALDEATIHDNILTFIGAGHETTANALTWSLYLLSCDPDWRAEVEAEATAWDEDGDISALVRTRATLEEALRLYPPAPALSREAIGPDELAGQYVPAGATVIVAPWVVHRHVQLWSEPEIFDPGRFMPGRRESIDRFAYIPFGAGPRICIGMGFALQEATLMLASIVKRWRLDLAPGHVVAPVQRITLKPKGGMPMILRRRD